MNNEISDSYEVQTGSVLRVEPGHLVVRVERDNSDCGGCRSCAVKALCRGRDDGHMDLPVAFSGNPPANRGDKVRIAFRATNAAWAAVAMFIPSLLGLFFGGFAGHYLAGESDRAFLAGCFIGLLAGVGISYVLSKSVPGLRPDVRLLER